MVNGYLGTIASRELEQFFSGAELRRMAYKYNGMWIVPTRSTFKSYLADIFPELPYLIHQNSPLVWAILSHIHRKQDETPMKRASTNLHRHQNTFYLQSLRFGVILHAKKILKTLEDKCVRCLRRKSQFLKQSIGQPLEATFQHKVRPLRHILMDLTGKHVAPRENQFMV